jgi:hypothetical protein
MLFGRYRDNPSRRTPIDYRRWVARDCRGATKKLRNAIRAENDWREGWWG